MIYLGPSQNYTLSDEAIHHILDGDITESQYKKPGEKVILTKVIAGGLHTVEGVKKFLLCRPDIIHGLFFAPNNNENWYYARELQNGVILLKIPREGFQSKAAKITEFPETYYKSGYLWKTLFPKEYTKEDIINAIDDALHNPDIEETSSDILIGYTSHKDIFKILKIRIQVRGTEILSAFPTWGQPMTGNNGKPFSHVDSINTIISGSSIFFRNEVNDILTLNNNYDHQLLDKIYKETPEFLLKRKKAPRLSDRVSYKKMREALLQKTAEEMDEVQLKDLMSLLIRYEFIRTPYTVMNLIYARCYNKIRQSWQFKNAIAIYQNFIDSLIVINKWDIINNSCQAFPIIESLLKTRFINTGGLDQWELKRLSNVIIEIVVSYKNPDISKQFLSLLSKSPCRAAFYIEFDVNIFFNTDIFIIGLSNNYEKPLEQKHFFEYVAQNLGVNYTLNFTHENNVRLAQSIQEDEGGKTIQLVNDCISFSVAKDFNLFITAFESVFDILVINEDSISIIDDILYDYHRCLASNIQRIIIKHRNIFSNPPEDEEFDTPKFKIHSKAKHEHMFLRSMYEMTITRISDRIKIFGYEDDAENILKKYGLIIEEGMKIPLPKQPEILRSKISNS